MRLSQLIVANKRMIKTVTQKTLHFKSQHLGTQFYKKILSENKDINPANSAIDNRKLNSNGKIYRRNRSNFTGTVTEKIILLPFFLFSLMIKGELCTKSLFNHNLKAACQDVIRR